MGHHAGPRAPARRAARPNLGRPHPERITGRGHDPSHTAPPTDPRLELAETKTARSRRTLHLPAPVIEALRQHRRRQAEEQLLAGPNGPPARSARTSVPNTVRHCRRSGQLPKPDVPSDRSGRARAMVTARAGHSAASLLLAMGVPLKLVSDVLGHSSIRITADVYGHLLDDAKAEAANAMTGDGGVMSAEQDHRLLYRYASSSRSVMRWRIWEHGPPLLEIAKIVHRDCGRLLGEIFEGCSSSSKVDGPNPDLVPSLRSINATTRSSTPPRNGTRKTPGRRLTARSSFRRPPTSTHEEAAWCA